jgi:hypothetical protein
MAGNLAHSRDDPRIADSTTDNLLLDHAIPGPGIIIRKRFGIFHFGNYEDKLDELDVTVIFIGLGGLAFPAFLIGL